MLEPGAQTAQAVLDQVLKFPHSHDQTAYESEGPCGTTRCVAGWARALHGLSNKDFNWDMEDEAARLLGLDQADADTLFLRTTNAQAVEALRWIARGDELVWSQIRNATDWEER